MELELSAKTESGGRVEVSEGTFGAPYNEALVHQVVTAYLAGGRAGTRAQKTRGEVRGGGAKPWRQKGTGRARAGSRRSPIWRGGGVTFAARPHSHAQKVNRKVYRAAMRSILSELARSGRLVLVEQFALAEPKTRALAAELAALGVDEVLIVSDQVDEALILAARNLPRVEVSEATHVDPVSLLSFDKILLTVGALRQLEERLA